MGLTGTLIDYILSTRWEDIPPSAREAQKASLVDGLGVMLAATGLDPASGAFRALAEEQGTGPCSLLGSERKTSPLLAALANGSLVHALDYEDSHERATVHPNSASIPALMALSQWMGGVSGSALLTALVLASDICCRLDLGVNEDLLKYGWIMPPIHGSMGAVMGAGKLLGLDRDQLLDAISLNLCQATCSGEAANSRESVIRTVREGFAAEAAVKSALLAKRGVHARMEAPLEGKLGYYHMYARGNYIPEKVTAGLGEVFESEMISFKPWPCCRATHTSIEAVLSVMGEEKLRPGEILGIRIVMQEIGRMVFEPREIKYRPGSPSIAKFSMPFLLGAAVCKGEITLDSFTPERLSDPEILALADRVTCEYDESLTKEQNKITDITIETARGTFHRHMEHPLGCLENPMSPQQRKKKFFDCASKAGKGYSPIRLEEIYETAQNLEQLENTNQLFDLL